VPPRLAWVFITAAAVLVATTTAVSHAGPRHRFCVSSIHGRFDSDQRGDSAVVFSTRRKCDTMEGRYWYLVVRLANGRALSRPLGHDRPAFSSAREVGCEAVCEVRAAPDFNRDGRHEIEVSLQQGASSEQRGVYGVVRGKLRRLPGGRAGARFSLDYGGTVRFGSYVVCRARAKEHYVVAVGWGITDNTHITAVQEDSYRFDGVRFRFSGTHSKRIRTAGLPPRVPGRTC